VAFVRAGGLKTDPPRQSPAAGAVTAGAKMLQLPAPMYSPDVTYCKLLNLVSNINRQITSLRTYRLKRPEAKAAYKY
jgi:hypothetical protein